MSSKCGKPLRDGPCVMDEGHRGRCTTVAFTCDSCLKTRRGDPVAFGYDTDGMPVSAHCFMCVKVYPPEPQELV